MSYNVTLIINKGVISPQSFEYFHAWIGLCIFHNTVHGTEASTQNIEAGSKDKQERL